MKNNGASSADLPFPPEGFACQRDCGKIFKEQLDQLAEYLQSRKLLWENETAVHSALRILKKQENSSKARSRLKIRDFGTLAYLLSRMEQSYSENFELEIFPDGTGRLIGETGKEFFWFENTDQLFDRLRRPRVKQHEKSVQD